MVDKPPTPQPLFYRLVCVIDPQHPIQSMNTLLLIVVSVILLTGGYFDEKTKTQVPEL